YLKKGTDSRSLETEEQMFTVTLEEAKELFAKPKQRGRRAAAAPLRELGTDPATGQKMVVKDGRFGPYVTDGETNASLRKGDEVESITDERAAELLAERRAKAPAKKTAAKKPAAKKPAAKKTAAKSTTATAAKKPAAKKTTGKTGTPKKGRRLPGGGGRPAPAPPRRPGRSDDRRGRGRAARRRQGRGGPRPCRPVVRAAPVHHPDGHDQRTPRRGRRPGRPGPLVRRS